MNLPKHLSASAINSFHNCPYSKYCEYKKRPKISVDRKGADFGKAVHLLIPQYYDSIDDFPSTEDLLDAVDISFSEGGNYATSNQEKKYERVKKHFIRFEKNRIRKKIKKPNIMEKSFMPNIFDDLPPFKIIPDAHFGDLKSVIDWKTGNNVQMDDDLVIQGLVYMLGMQKEGYDVEKVVFVDLTRGNEPPMPKVTPGFLHSKAKQMCDMIEADKFPTKETYLCRWCEFKLSCDLRFNCPWEGIW